MSQDNLAEPASAVFHEKKIWDDVLSWTAGENDHALSEVRIALHVLLLKAQPATWRDRLRAVQRLGRVVFMPRKPLSKRLPRNGLLFGFFHATASNVNNLLPLLNGAKVRAKPVLVLRTSDVTFTSEQIDVGSQVTVDELTGDASIGERFSSIARAFKSYAKLNHGVRSKDRGSAKIIRSHRLSLTTDFAVSYLLRGPLQRLFEQVRPAALISTSDLWTVEHTVYTEAARRGIPSYVVQHGVLNVFWYPFVAKTLILWGEAFRAEMIRLGAPSNRLAVAGMPATDGLFDRYRERVETTHNNKKKAVLLLSHTHGASVFPALFQNYKTILKEAVETCDSVEWVVKLHPSEDEAYYHSMGEKVMSRLTVLPRSCSLENALTSCDIACTLFSTAGLEAMIVGRPLLVFNTGPQVEEFAWWPKQGGGHYVSNCAELKDFLARAQLDDTFLDSMRGRQDNFLQNTFANQGKSADAILELIEVHTTTELPS